MYGLRIVCFLLIALLNVGCETDLTPASKPVNTLSQPAPSLLRLIVNFQEAAPMDKHKVLDSVVKETGAKSVQLISESTADSWILLVEPNHGQSTEALLIRLKQMKSVKTVEIDIRAKQH